MYLYLQYVASYIHTYMIGIRTHFTKSCYNKQMNTDGMLHICSQYKDYIRSHI